MVFSAINRKAKRLVLRQIKKRPLVMMSDTTLRDGAQMPGVRLSLQDKVTIARALADAGIHSIDVGFPAVGPPEVAAIKEVAANVSGPVLSCLSRALPADVDLAADALSACPRFKRAVTIFIGTSPTHREHKHQCSKAEIVDKAVRAIEHAGKQFDVISFGAEDASRTEPEFLHEIYEKAIQAGATSIGFTDTVGYLIPSQVERALGEINARVRSIDDALLAVHFHNDLGLATANTLTAIKCGANIVQGTVNGIGERAGNVSLEEVLITLTLHRDEFGKTVHMKPEKIDALCRLVAELTGWQPAVNKPVTGRNMFRTEAGIHQHGLLQNPETYLPFQPELIGAGPVELVLGPGSGHSAVRHHLEKKGIEVTDEMVGRVVSHLKGDLVAAGADDELNWVVDVLRDHLSSSLDGTPESKKSTSAP